MQEPNLLPLFVAVALMTYGCFHFLLWTMRSVICASLGALAYVCILAFAFFSPQYGTATILFGVGMLFIVGSILLFLLLPSNNTEKGETS